MTKLSFIPAYPRAGECGSSMSNPRVSTRWPGGYTGKCFSCSAIILAEKRAPRCDLCEDRRLATVAVADAEQRAKSSVPTIVDALRTITERYVLLAGSIDQAWSDPELEPEVIAARGFLKGTTS